ncbi:GntR family transcriptional regulator [Treponema sp. SP13]|uniref:GntR family transcriptional regulator n=1 Tax=Treponema sp. SP13 TaxID=2789742 RepID=UPI003D8D7B9C
MKYLKDTAYEIIKKNILDCKYEPGTVLNETLLIKDIGVSRTPVHNALAKLQSENLVTLIPKKGAIVCGITLKDMLEVLDIRLLLEPELVRRYGDMLDKSKLEKFIKRCERVSSLGQKLHLHMEFHSILYNSCPNRRLREILLNLESQNIRNRTYHPNEIRLNKSFSEDITIAKYVLRGDFERAAQAVRTHLEEARKFAMIKYV